MEVTGEAEKWSYILWNIKNFFSLHYLATYDHEVHDTTIQLFMKLNLSLCNSDEDCYELHYYGRNSRTSKSFPVSIYVKDKYGNDHFQQSDTIKIIHFVSSSYSECYTQSGSTKLWSVRRRDLQAKSKLLLQKDGSLQIACMFGPESQKRRGKINENAKENKTCSAQTSSDWSCLESLSEDLHNYLVNDVEPDVLLRCGENTFSAHQSILSARSDVFKAMFHHDMMEGLNGSVNIEDMEPEQLKLFLDYVYSGKLSNLSKDSATHLYAAANKYGIEALKKKCTNFLMENITEKEALSIMILADAHNDEEFKKRIVKFVTTDDEICNENGMLEHSEKPVKLLWKAFVFCCTISSNILIALYIVFFLISFFQFVNY